jgi:methylenetetrahydrofolate reductase (NADPH)
MRVSFEVFPPKSPEAHATLWQSIEQLEPLRPHFVSVTYGANGSDADRSHATVERLVSTTTVTTAAHVTCAGQSREAVDAVVLRYREAGVRHIVALRGDPPGGAGGRYEPHPQGYRNATELVAGITRQLPDVEVSVSAYPEKHPESPTLDLDLDVLQAKVDAGASRAITQFFFDNDHYFRYVDRVRARGIDIPIVPGIMPVQNFEQTSSFAAKCGATIPPRIAARFAGLEHDPHTRKLVAANVATEQVLALADAGVRDLHFYTMNRGDLVYSICRVLDIHPEPVASPAIAGAGVPS